MPAATIAPALGAISVNEVYPWETFKALTGLNRWALRAAEKKGLKTSKVGRRKYIAGRAWLDFLEGQADAD